MRITHCDRCHEACTDRPVLVLERKNGQTDRLPVVIDLCLSCAVALEAWLRTEAPDPAARDALVARVAGIILDRKGLPVCDAARAIVDELAGRN